MQSEQDKKIQAVRSWIENQTGVKPCTFSDPTLLYLDSLTGYDRPVAWYRTALDLAVYYNAPKSTVQHLQTLYNYYSGELVKEQQQKAEAYQQNQYLQQAYASNISPYENVYGIGGIDNWSGYPSLGQWSNPTITQPPKEQVTQLTKSQIEKIVEQLNEAQKLEVPVSKLAKYSKKQLEEIVDWYEKHKNKVFIEEVTITVEPKGRKFKGVA